MIHQRRMRLQGRSENRNKNTPEHKTDATENGWGSQRRQPAWDVRLSLPAMQASSAQWALGAWATCMRYKDQEGDLGKGRRGCQSSRPASSCMSWRRSPYPWGPRAPQLTLVLQRAPPRAQDKLQDKKSMFK